MVHDFKLLDDKKMTFRTFSSFSVVKNKSDFKLLQFEAILFQLETKREQRNDLQKVDHLNEARSSDKQMQEIFALPQTSY